MQEQLLKNPAGIREEKLITQRCIVGALVSEPESNNHQIETNESTDIDWF